MRVGEGEEGSKNPKVEGSVTKTIAWSRPLIFLLHHPGLPTPTPTPGSPFQAHTALTEGSGNRRRQNWSGVESWVSSRTLGF